MINKFVLIGNIGKAPELKSTATGLKVARFSLATTKYVAKTKERSTQWHYVTVFGTAAERAVAYGKGVKVYCEGSIEPNSYEKDGQKIYKVDFIANTFFALEKVNHGGASEAVDDTGEFAQVKSNLPLEPSFTEGDVPF
jgi:single-strand DNA-binding protein